METPKRNKPHWLRGVILIVMVVACLLLPTLDPGPARR